MTRDPNAPGVAQSRVGLRPRLRNRNGRAQEEESFFLGTSFIPHFGHLPGWPCTTSGCIGQVYWALPAGGAGLPAKEPAGVKNHNYASRGPISLCFIRSLGARDPGKESKTRPRLKPSGKVNLQGVFYE